MARDGKKLVASDMVRKAGRASHRPGQLAPLRRDRPRSVKAPAPIREERVSSAIADPESARLPPKVEARSISSRAQSRAAFAPSDYRFLDRDLRQVALLAGSIVAAMIILWALHQAGIITFV